jgi:hypothetical protein
MQWPLIDSSNKELTNERSLQRNDKEKRKVKKGQISLKHPYKNGKLDESLYFEKSDEEDVPLHDYTPFHFIF